MSTAISSSLIANSKIVQNQAKFSFPLTLPLQFTIQNQTNNIADSANVVATSLLSGQLKMITPITSNTLCTSSIIGAISNSFNLLAPTLNGTSTINSIIESDLGLIGPIVSITSLIPILSNNIKAISLLTSTTSMSSIALSNINVTGSISTATTIAGITDFGSVINGNITSASTISGIISIKVFYVPQVINSTSTITDIETAIFKAITNIVANASIAGTTNIQEVVTSDLGVNSYITGNTLNNISGSLNVNGNIAFPQTFNFPMTFPLVFINNITKNILINPYQITASSLIIASICSPLNSLFNATSTVDGTIKNIIQLKSSLVSTTNIANSSFTGLIPLSSNIQIESTINTILVLNIKLNGNVNCTTSIPNISITIKISATFETSITEKSIIPNYIRDTLYPVNVLATSTFSSEILKVENIVTNLQMECIFCCNQNFNVQICNKNKTVSMITDLTEKAEFSSIITSSTLNLFTIFNVEFKKILNVTSFKEE